MRSHFIPCSSMTDSHASVCSPASFVFRILFLVGPVCPIPNLHYFFISLQFHDFTSASFSFSSPLFSFVLLILIPLPLLLLVCLFSFLSITFNRFLFPVLTLARYFFRCNFSLLRFSALFHQRLLFWAWHCRFLCCCCCPCFCCCCRLSVSVAEA